MTSVWRDQSNIPKFKTLQHDTQTDVLIIGGGLAGILCAHELQKAGISYILAEAHTICSGITQNTTAKITSQHGLIYHKLIRNLGTEQALQYLKTNEEALSKYRQLCTDIDCDFEEKDAYVYSLDDSAKLELEVDALRRLGFPATYTQDLPLPFPTAGAVKFPRQAQFNPLKFISSISKDLNIFEHTTIKELADHTAITDRGKITANKIIVATHFPFLNKHGSYFLKMYQHRSYVLALTSPATIQLNGMYVDDRQTGMSFRTYKDLLLIGGGDHRTGKTGGCYQELRTFAKEHYPSATEQYAWATQDCMTLDGIPYIGQYSKHTPGLYVATGFNKWGMTSSMAAAQILSGMITGVHHPCAPVFSPSRSILKPQLAINAFEATTNLLTISKKRCPHLGCALKWNSAEHTWDCPCHGSRFEENGTLIDNPATGNLRK